MVRRRFFFKVLVLASALACLATNVRAQQTLVTFDDLPVAYMPNSYQGLSWSNFGVFNGLTYANNPSGYQAGVVSSSNVVYPRGSTLGPTSISNAVPFDLISAYLTAAWNDNLQFTAVGFVNGRALYSNTYTLSATVSTLILFNYLGVERVSFNSYGGTHHTGYSKNGQHFAMDNLTYSKRPTARTWESGLNRSYSDGTITMPYRLYLPKNYTSTTNYPLILFLHGEDGYGMENVAQVTNHITGLIARTYSDYPALLVVPQLPKNIWYGIYDLSLGILAQVRQNYSVDERRLYLTGFSLGGFGCTDYAYYFPTLFAAIAPMSGARDYSPSEAPPLSQIPTWLFHGSADSIVPVAYSRNYYTNVTGLTDINFNQTKYGYPTATSGVIRYTELTGLDHNIGELIYGAANSDLYTWMFSQIRPLARNALTSVTAVDNAIFFSATNSVPFTRAYLLASTNVATPLAQWTRLATNWFGADGGLILSNNIEPNGTQRFYILQTP